MDIVDTLFAAGFSEAFSASFLTGAGVVLEGLETGCTLGEHAASKAIPAKNNHLLPLDSGRWFRTDVIYYPVDSFYVVNDLVGDFGQQIVGKVAPVGGHAVQ